MEPYASTRTVSRSAGDAFPVRTPPNSRRTVSRAFSILSRALFRLLGMGTPFVWTGSRVDQRPDALAADHPRHGAGGPQVEHHDRDAVILAERERGRVHHRQLAGERIHEGDL